MITILTLNYNCNHCKDCYLSYREHPNIHPNIEDMLLSISKDAEVVLEVYHNDNSSILQVTAKILQFYGTKYSVTSRLEDVCSVPDSVIQNAEIVSLTYHPYEHIRDVVRKLNGKEIKLIVSQHADVLNLRCDMDILGLSHAYLLMHKGDPAKGWNIGEHIQEYTEDYMRVYSNIDGNILHLDPCVMAYLTDQNGPCHSSWVNLDPYGRKYRCPYSSCPDSVNACRSNR